MQLDKLHLVKVVYTEWVYFFDLKRLEFQIANYFPGTLTRNFEKTLYLYYIHFICKDIYLYYLYIYIYLFIYIYTYNIYLFSSISCIV